MTFRILLALLLATAFHASPVRAADAAGDKSLVPVRAANERYLRPGEFDGDIARATGLLLQQSHYSQQGFNSEVSSKFLDRYLDTLDPMHLYFLKSDVESFEMFRTTLDKLTLRRADPTPGFAIYNRYMDRLEQQYAFITEFLKEHTWNFDDNSRYTPNRKDLPRPKDLTEAKLMWKERVRFEYLSEKLNQPRPDEIVKIIRDLMARPSLKTNDVAAALKDKLGKDRLADVVKLFAARTPADTADTMAKAVAADLESHQHEEIMKTIGKRYSRVVRMFRDFDSDDVMQFYLSALAHVYDPHSDYMGRAELDNFSITMNLSLFGIGAVLRSEDGFCKIQELMAAGPASKSGKLKPNDKILAVAQADAEFVDVVDMKLRKVVDLIRGPKGTKVRLRINPADAADPSLRREIELTRDEIKLEDQAAKARLLEFPDQDGKIRKVGLIDLPSFYASFAVGSQARDNSEGSSTTGDVAKLLARLTRENVAGIILDLRRNGGGSLEEAINLTGLFIKKGPIVQVRNPDDSVDIDEDRDPRVQYDGPMVVLTSRFSASASEILAGALQDYGRAVIVGDVSTHGKGTVQQVTQLNRLLRTTNNLGALKFTLRKFYRASGDSTQLKGVVPDVVLPSVNNVADVGEVELDNALPFDTIKPATYEKLDRVAPLAAQLRELSTARVDKDRDFKWVKEEMDRYRKLKADKSVSMNEETRRKEKAEVKARTDARKKELVSLGEFPGKVYELKLKDVDSPALTLMVKTNKLTASGSAVPDPKVAPEDSEEAALEDSIPDRDYVAEEAKHILMDFVRLSGAQKGVVNAK